MGEEFTHRWPVRRADRKEQTDHLANGRRQCLVAVAVRALRLPFQHLGALSVGEGKPRRKVHVTVDSGLSFQKAKKHLLVVQQHKEDDAGAGAEISVLKSRLVFFAFLNYLHTSAFFGSQGVVPLITSGGE